MKARHPFAAAILASLWLVASASHADEGHGEPAAPNSTGQAHPRFTAESETFELVGVLEGRRLTLYLDRFADNSPVKNAQVELEVGGVKLDVKPGAEGMFEAVLAAVPQPGALPVTATIVAGSEADLLAGELDIHKQPTAGAGAARGRDWAEIVRWAAAGLVALAVLFGLVRRLLKGRAARTGDAA